MQSLEEVKEKLKVFDRPDFIFDEIPHKYYLAGENLPSATGIPHKFCRYVDWVHWQQVKATELDMTPAEVKAMWQANTDAACLLGTNIHKFIENHIGDIPQSLGDYSDEEQVMIKGFLAFYETRMKGKLIPIAQELRMFSERMGIAGTLDNLSYLPDSSGTGGKVLILDMKTNAKWEDDRNKRYSKLLNEFSSEWDNKANHYSIQLSIYRLMLEEIGVQVADTLVIYIPRDGETKLIRCKDYTPQLKEYFNL